MPTSIPGTGGNGRGFTPFEIIGGGVLGGIIIGFWSTIKLYVTKIVRLFIAHIDIDNYQLGTAIHMLLQSKFRCSSIGTKNYVGSNEYVRPLKRIQLVAMELVPFETTVWWRGWKPLIVSRLSSTQIKLTFFRGIFNADKLLLEAVADYNDEASAPNWREHNRFWIKRLTGTIGKSDFNSNRSDKNTSEDKIEVAPDRSGHSFSTLKQVRMVGWNREDVGQPYNKEVPFDNLCLNRDMLDAIEEATAWRDSEDWFKNKLIPWKRGFLCYGVTGTGKTAFVRALGKHLNMPIFQFDLATMTNQDFIVHWSSAMSQNPCIMLFEDIDAVFEGRKNIAVQGMESGLSFDCFLNTIDGVQNTDGCFVIITTNNIDKIDPALGIPTNGNSMSTRPGRIDRTIKFVAFTQDDKVKMAERILSDFPREKWQGILEDNKTYTGAQFQDKCSKLALKLFWEKRNKPTS